MAISAGRKRPGVYFLVALSFVMVFGAGVYAQVAYRSTQVAAAPVMSSLSPISGSTNGGTTVVIDGSGFRKTVSFVKISTGGAHSCGIATDGWAYCWGPNHYGELGTDRIDISGRIPVSVMRGAIPQGADIVEIQAGRYSTCAIVSDQNVYCWGRNSDGQLGNGTTADSNLPVLVARGEMPVGVGIKEISMKDSFACGVATDDRAYCWGANYNGQLGNGTTIASSVPVAVLRVRYP